MKAITIAILFLLFITANVLGAVPRTHFTTTAPTPRFETPAPMPSFEVQDLAAGQYVKSCQGGTCMMTWVPTVKSTAKPAVKQTVVRKPVRNVVRATARAEVRPVARAVRVVRGVRFVGVRILKRLFCR